MSYVICILISVFISAAYTNIMLNKMSKLNAEYMQKYSLVTFDSMMEVLKKCGVVKDKDKEV